VQVRQEEPCGSSTVKIAKLDAAMTRQKLGQHFLSDLSWRKRILQTLNVAQGETWLEIGAGHGEMTELLARAGARVVAIETDSQLAEGLAKHSASWGHVQVVPGDVLQLDLRALAGESVRVYGNLPYYITSPILRRLFALADRIKSIDIVIQLEVAARIAAPPGGREHGYLSALCQFYSKPEIVLRIPAGAFRPPPEVTSALVNMTMPGERATLEIKDEPRFLEFLQTCFGQKRKTLRNNLRGLASGPRIEAALQKYQITPKARAEELTLQQFAEVYEAIQVA
jgi:16S rRNA (adenine1518-N6/adenine1519-N6)-dimethyltransferase